MGNPRNSADPTVPSCAHEHPVREVPQAVPTPQAFERAAAIFRAAGDAARLRLLFRLSSGERCVSELASDTGEGLSTVSQRLKVLRSDGLVSRRRDGKHIFYGLADRHVAEILGNVLDHASEPVARTADTKEEDDEP